MRILASPPAPSKSLPHWNYFLAIEEDINRLGRYVELAPANFPTYSIEMARMLMAATQEIDVLLKQLCAAKGQVAKDEQGYRHSVPQLYSRFGHSKIQVIPFGLDFIPFASWHTGITPKWWTANNKVKHERHTHFREASLENTLNAACGLLVANLYYHDAIGAIADLFPSTKHLVPVGMIEAVEPSFYGGLIPKYKIL